MKIHLVSDLHLDVNTNFVLPKTESDVLVVVGDMHNGKIRDTIDFLEEWRTWHHKPVIFVAGNHDFYHYEINAATVCFKTLCKDIDVTFLDNSSYLWSNPKTEEKVLFVGGTMWSDQSFNAAGVQNDLADYHFIKNSANCKSFYDGPGLIRDKDTIGLHNEFLMKAEGIVNKHEGKICMVTHHGPSAKSIHPDYDGDTHNGYFSSPVIENYRWTDKIGRAHV